MQRADRTMFLEIRDRFETARMDETACIAKAGNAHQAIQFECAQRDWAVWTCGLIDEDGLIHHIKHFLVRIEAGYGALKRIQNENMACRQS